MSKSVKSQFNAGSNEKVAYASFITFHEDSIEESYKQ